MIIKTLKEYFNNRKELVQFLGDQYEQSYIEIPPFTKNDKGEWLNDSSQSIWVKGDKINIFELIQSHRDSVDLSKLIDMVNKTGDISYLKRKQGFYADISQIPTNQNDFKNYVDGLIDTLSGIDKDIALKIINGDSSNDEIYRLFNDKYGKNDNNVNNNVNNVEVNNNE